MTAISFTNPGEIDPRSFIKLGWNAKPTTQNPFGFFGSGLKYSIAIVLRCGGSIKIWSGLAGYEFRAVEEEFRGTTQTDIQYRELGEDNWHSLNYGLDWGKKWEPWMVFRELYCNAKDEGGGCQLGAARPEAGTTVVLVTGMPELIEAYEKRSAFMLDLSQKPLVSGLCVDVYKGRSNAVYYRGILVGQTEEVYDFTYNLTTPIDLTEDRTMKNQYLFKHLVTQTWLRMSMPKSRPELVRQVLTGDPKGGEAQLPWDSTAYDPSDDLVEVIEDLRREGAAVNDRIRMMHDKYRTGDTSPEEIVPTTHEVKMIERAKHVIHEVFGYDVAHPIKVCRSLGQGRFGMAHKGTIYLTKRALEAGQVWVTGTILEEYGHLALCWKDETRDMQNSLINMLAGLAERHELLMGSGQIKPVKEIPF
ncbi:MAG: hypothetical protein ACXWWG_00500 [Nitrospira sp.]